MSLTHKSGDHIIYCPLKVKGTLLISHQDKCVNQAEPGQSRTCGHLVISFYLLAYGLDESESGGLAGSGPQAYNLILLLMATSGC